MWHVTHDKWHVTHGGGWTFYQNFSSLALTVWHLWHLVDWEEKERLLNQWINNESVSRTAPATPGLLKMVEQTYNQVVTLLCSCWRIPILEKISTTHMKIQKQNGDAGSVKTVQILCNNYTQGRLIDGEERSTCGLGKEATTCKVIPHNYFLNTAAKWNLLACHHWVTTNTW